MNIERLCSSDDPRFEAAMAIYERAFPANERHPKHVIKERLDSGKYQFFIGTSDGRPVLMATFWPLKGTEFMLFDYMAVTEDARGLGHAADFLAKVWEHVGPGASYLLLEVEDPTKGTNPAERKARIGLYERHNARLMKDVRYILPPLSAPGQTDMVLMVICRKMTKSLPGRTVRALMTQVYLELYGRGPKDALLRSFIDKVPDTVEFI